jgi:haloalkane dehalogenase
LLCWSRDIPVVETDPSYPEMKRIEERLSLFRGIPVLLVGGMRDPVLTPAVLCWWQTCYPHAVTREIEDASHFVQEDAPDQVAGWVEQFLDSTP